MEHLVLNQKTALTVIIFVEIYKNQNIKKN